MNRKYSLIYFFTAFANGLTVPFISLICLSHGASLENLSLIISVFAITVILVEVPSGMISDMMGRKSIFIMSQFSLAWCYVAILGSNSWIWLVIAYILKGVGIAFASGSLESLIVEEHIRNCGKETLSHVNSQLLKLEYLGSLSGALIGGIIGSLGENYILLLMVRIVLGILIAVSSGILIKVQEEHISDIIRKTAIWEQLCLMKDTVKYSNIIGIMLWVAFFYGSVVAMMETYWQQNLLTILNNDHQWIYGIVSCLGYVGAILGGRTGTKIRECNHRHFYRIIRIAIPVAIWLLGNARKWHIFIFVYFIIYYIMGIGDLLERNMLHANVENECRASILSLYSLFMRGGGAFSAVLSSGIVILFGLNVTWIIIPIFVVVVYMIIFSRYEKA